MSVLLSAHGSVHLHATACQRPSALASSRTRAFKPAYRYARSSAGRLLSGWSRPQLNKGLVHAQAETGKAALVAMDEPGSAKEAIEQGLLMTKAKRWADALAKFEAALTLPGTGVKRFRDKPAALSDGERMTALYNIACCQSQLEDARSGLIALAGCLELGYGDLRQMRQDPDLAFLRSDPKFEGLLQRFEPKNKGMFGGFFG